MKNAKTLLLVLGSVLLLAVGTAGALPPRITWDPNPLVTEEIAPGEEASYSVTLTNTGYLPILAAYQLRIVAEGDIVPYLTIEQPKFPSTFKRGQSVTFSVKVAIPEETPAGEVNGTLILKRVIRNKVVDVWRAEALPVDLTFSPIPLPPDPGEAGKITLEGIDSDKDGVRDDIQRWILFTSPQSESTRAALTQGALALQEALLVASDKERAIELAGEDKSPTCLVYVAGDEAPRLMAELEAEIANTEARSRAYIAYNANLGGQVFEGLAMDEWKAACSFDADSMGD